MLKPMYNKRAHLKKGYAKQNLEKITAQQVRKEAEKQKRAFGEPDVRIRFNESLILAQDERWRRA